MSPGKGPEAGGTSVTITGSNLDEATAVTFGSTAATSFKMESGTSIVAVAPAGTGTVDVSVSTPGGTSATSSADEFTYSPMVTLTSSTNPSVYGQKVTFTAKVNPTKEGDPTPTGTVEFLNGTTVLGSAKLNSTAVATFSSSSLGAGDHTIVAEYGGDTHNSSGESAGVAQVVDQAATQVALTGSPNPAPHGSSVTLLATVKVVAPGGGTRTGTVTFKDGTTTLAAVKVSGDDAKYSLKTLAVGPHTITAAYSGDANNESSESSITQTIVKASTQVMLTSSESTAPHGSSGYLQATVKVADSGSGSPTGTVTFMEGSTPLATVALSGKTAKYKLNTFTPGTHTITATYNGDESNESSTSAGFPQSITKASTKITLMSSMNPALHGSSGYLLATVKVLAPGSGALTGTVTFKEGSTTLATVALSGATAKYSLKTLASGTHTITATYSGDGNNEPSESAGFIETIEP